MIDLLKKRWFVYTAGMAFFFVLFRYYGYFEDAGRYLLQVVHFLHPDRFVDDVPFMFGNQDSFTIFSPLMIAFFKLFGVNHGGMVAVFLFEFLWGIAAITLAVRWTTRWSVPTWALPVFVVTLVVFTNKMYGSGAYFPIIDHILVARFIAEIFILFGLAFLWSHNRFVSLGMFLLASVFHPLMGGWGIPLWLLYHYPKWRLPLMIGALLAPLTGLLRSGRLDFYPADWFGGGLPFAPTGEDALFFTCVLVFWWIVWKFCKELSVSNFAAVLFWITLAGIFLQYAGIGFRHQLLVQVQPYRVLWLSFVPMVPIASLCLLQFFREPSCFSKWLDVRPRFARLVFGLSLAFFVASAFLGNIVQLALEQDIGSAEVALRIMEFSEQLILVHKAVLFCLALICLAQRRFWFAFAFGLSLINGCFTILPMIAVVLYLFPSIKGWLWKFLVSISIVYSFAEYLSALPASPLLGSGLLASLLLAVMFAAVLGIFCFCKSRGQRFLWLPLAVITVLLVAWNIIYWDVREESRELDERQMDSFFEESIFPQVKDRGRILFVENGESPLQSRFKFLTGTYADETINVGELFYRGQFQEAVKRKNMLLLGDSVIRDWGNYTQRIAKVYANQDTLLARVFYLCSIGEVSHFVTDYADMPLPKEDSLFLGVKQKYVWLYECPVDKKNTRIEGIF